jgi:hypothetical protein
MKVYIVGISDCESSSTIAICATKEIAERELFKARDELIAEWTIADKAIQQSIEEFCKKEKRSSWIDSMYKDMIIALSSNDYEKWDNYPHEKPYIHEMKVLTE